MFLWASVVLVCWVADLCVWQQLQNEVDALADRVELANNALKGDWSHWKNSMRTDLKSAFISTAEKNVDYYEKVRLSVRCVCVLNYLIITRMFVRCGHI